MIAVDTSALMAIVLDEPEAQACRRAIAIDQPRIMSAVTLAEALIVAGRRGLAPRLAAALEVVNADIMPATAQVAARVSEVYGRWGKGAHPARLNLVDCFAYDAAKTNGCPLLYVGDDFVQTDVASALVAD